jgi:hypothetical protein
MSALMLTNRKKQSSHVEVIKSSRECKTISPAGLNRLIARTTQASLADLEKRPVMTLSPWGWLSQIPMA